MAVTPVIAVAIALPPLALRRESRDVVVVSGSMLTIEWRVTAGATYRCFVRTISNASLTIAGWNGRRLLRVAAFLLTD